MKNAQMRFGHLTYTRISKKAATQFRVPVDRFVGELSRTEAKAHLVSVVGGDTQMAAMHAAIINGDQFSLEAGGRILRISLGANAECFRASLNLENHPRPVRHLLAISQELAQSGRAPDTTKTILLDDSAQFIWNSLAQIHGLPGACEWAEWIVGELKRQRRIVPLEGIGCNPVLVKGGRPLLLSCISRGVRRGRLAFPQENGPVEWPSIPFRDLLLAESPELCPVVSAQPARN
jgi:hypothetical protein